MTVLMPVTLFATHNFFPSTPFSSFPSVFYLFAITILFALVAPLPNWISIGTIHHLFGKVKRRIAEWPLSIQLG